MGVDVSLNSENRELSIRVSGRFDFSVHQDFRKATEQVVDTVNSIVIDLARTDYLDSSALGMLLVLRDKVGENKKAITIIKAKPEVKNILKIANFDKLFTLL